MKCKVDWKEFFKLTPLKVIILVIAFAILFFVNFQALFEPCNYYVCEDFYRTDLITGYPNFYTPADCGIIWDTCWEASVSIGALLRDVFLWVIVNLIGFSIIYKCGNKNKTQTNNKRITIKKKSR